jgi:acyl-CoA synthetase (AMP-forming)/AMP-acid ligase II
MSSSASAPLPDTVLTRLARWAASQPDKPCYTFCDAKMRVSRSLTYAQLDGVTAALAARLVAPKESSGGKGGKGGKGGGYALSRGDRVLLVYPPSLDFVAAYLACLRAGLVAVPVFPPIPGQLKKDLHHFASIHGSSGARVALTNTTYNHAKRLVQLKEKFSTGKVRWPEDIRWIITDKDLTVDAKSASVAPAAVPPAAATPEGTVTAAAGGTDDAGGFARDSLAFLQYTSGSTSEPKGVMISHGNLAHNLSTIVAALGADQNTSCVAWLPQYHDMGLIGSYLGTLYCGGSGYYMSPISFVKRPVMWVEMMSKYKATHTQAPNFAYKLAARKFHAMPEAKRPRGLDLSTLQHMFNAAEPVTMDAIADFEAAFCPVGLPRGVIVPGYGLAEHTVYVCDRGRQRVRVNKRVLLEEHRAEVLEVFSDQSCGLNGDAAEGKEGTGKGEGGGGGGGG